MESLTPEQQALFEGGGQLGDYEVLKPIGKGKFSVVFKAVRRRDEQPVALKKIAIFDLMDARAREKTLKEVRLVQSVSHPNIVQYLDAFIESKELYIAFEWAEAGDLKRQIRKANEKSLRFEERTIWRYFSQLCAALLHLHRARIMHRDLKPANIFLTLQGVVKVGDLGLGRHLSENTLEARSKVGTPLYMSPEVLRGDPYDWKSDVWSLGCILYELAMLRSPFKSEGLNLYGLFQKINKGEYEEVPPLYSDHLRRLVTRMISLTAADRPTMEEVWTWCERRPTSAALQRKPSGQPARANVEQKGPTRTTQQSESWQLEQPARQPGIVAEPSTGSRPPSASPTNKQQESGSLSRPPSSSSDNRASAKTDSSAVPTNLEESKLKSAERRMELLFDRLCLLRYEQALGKAISRKHFLGASRFLPGGDEAKKSRFDDFVRVGRWLLGRLGQDLDNNEGRGVSPIITCQRMLIAADRAGVPEVAAISAPTLVDGVGGDVCEFLDAICERVLRVEGLCTARISYPVEQIEVAEGDDALEVADDDCVGSNDASGDSETASSPFIDSDLFGEWLIARHEGCATGAGDDENDREWRQMIHARIDPAVWQQEVQRAIPRLRQALVEKLSARSQQAYWESRVASTMRLCQAVDDCDGPKRLATQLYNQRCGKETEQLERLEKWLNDRYLRVRRHFHDCSQVLAETQSNALAAQSRVAQASVQLRELQDAVAASTAALKARNERLSDRSELAALQRQLRRVEGESRAFAEQLAALHDLHWRKF